MSVLSLSPALSDHQLQTMLLSADVFTLELQMNLREDFIITEKASTSEHIFFQATFNNLCAIVPISRLLTVFRRPFSIA